MASAHAVLRVCRGAVIDYGVSNRLRDERRGVMRHDIEEKVLEKLATWDRITIVIERQPDGKMRVTSGS